jgi:hypothetical protein
MNIPEDMLWKLIDKWQAAARSNERGPYLASDPATAFGQAMNEAADDLSDLILDLEDEH